MDDTEVNKIIAEFMGDRHTYPVTANNFDLINYYTKYLDSLVPVWKKMGRNSHEVLLHPIYRNPDVYIGNGITRTSSGVKDTIQQAAAYATAKAILELKE